MPNDALHLRKPRLRVNERQTLISRCGVVMHNVLDRIAVALHGHSTFFVFGPQFVKTLHVHWAVSGFFQNKWRVANYRISIHNLGIIRISVCSCVPFFDNALRFKNHIAPGCSNCRSNFRTISK